MKVIVTPEDQHPVAGHPGDFRMDGDPYTGQALIVTSEHVMVDGRVVLQRDRRAKVNRTAGHPWYEPETTSTWTGFSVEVRP